MATFLVTSRMDPALAERVEASVRGQRGQRGQSRAHRTRRFVSLARLLLVVSVAYAIYGGVVSRRQGRRELEHARGSLLESADRAGAGLTPDDRQAVRRAESWLTRLAGTYEGDLVDEPLRARGALGATLARDVLYVRGPLGAFGGSREALAGAAATSAKDPLLLCLAERPSARTEAALFETTRAAYAGGSVLEQRTANVRRLHEAIVGLPFLEPAWADSVRTAETSSDVARLRQQFERAPLERAKQAARATILLAALDEPGDGKGPTELDGERPHAVRVAVVDLGAARILLRLRIPVDPSWISPSRRPTYAAGLDGCALAFDVHTRVTR